MNKIDTIAPLLTSGAQTQNPWLNRRLYVPLIVAAGALLLATAALSRSLYDGRLANPITHNDVNYFLVGIRYLVLLRTQGVLALVDDFVHNASHAVINSYQPMLAYLVFGVTDWAPYVSNIVYVFILLGVSAYLLGDCPPVILAAAVTIVVAMPLSSSTIVEFAPELICSLFTAIGAVLMLRLPLFGAPLGARFRAGLCFCLGFLAHPSAFAFTLIAMLGTTGLVFLRDTIVARNYRWSAAIGLSLLNVALSTWLAALYMVPRYDVYWQYFYRTTLNPATRWRWVSDLTFGQHVSFYLFGQGGEFMFGNRLLECAAITGLGIAAAWWRQDRQLAARQVELILVATLFWLVPTLSPVKVSFFAATFGYTVIFLTVISFGSIFQSVRNTAGAVVACTVAALLLMSDVSRQHVPNTPSTLTDRQFAFNAINRLRTVLFGNATEYGYTKVYLTNIGAYAENILFYYILKVDPTLHWNLESGVVVPDPHEQINSIHSGHEDFVIAGHFDNGFTYSEWAQPAEEPVLSAISHDPGYIPIDRFYGPNGRTVTVFQRRGSFAGWHGVSGIVNPSGEQDGVRISTGGVAYLRTYAARAVPAELHIECAGPPGQTVAVLVNQQKVAEETFSAGTGSASLNQPIALSVGNNDIVLQYPSGETLTLQRLLIIPHIDSEG
jgi:hypothetical protein